MGKRYPIDLKFYIHVFGTVIEYKKIITAKKSVKKVKKIKKDEIQ